MNRKMKRKALWIVGVVVVAVLVGGGLLFSQLSRSNGNSAQASNAQATRGTPSLQIEATDLDLGTLSVKEERMKEITLTNTGKGPLQISSVNTSCMCTFAQFVIAGTESPELTMTMHMSGKEINWIGTIAPGQSAILRAIYRPSKMPVKGRVDREIFFNTNDPTHPKVTVRFQAVVQD